MVDHPQEEALHLREYLQIIRKRLWLILAILLIAVGHTVVTSMRLKPVYRATAQVLIERYNPQVVKVEEVMALDAYAVDYYPTQYKLLKTRSLAREVIQRLDLNHDPSFNAKPKRRWFQVSLRKAVASVVRAVMPKKRSEDKAGPSRKPVDPLTPYIDAYLSRLKIEPIEESRLVNISFEGGDPALVARIANAHAQAYIDRDLEMKLSAAEDAVNWLRGRLDDLKEKLRESEEALQRFQEEEDIVALENILSGSGGSEESILAQKLAELSSSITATRTERIGLETVYLQLKEFSKNPTMAESIPQVIQNPLIQSLKEDYISLSQEYSELRAKYGKKHPRMVALRREIQGLRSRIRQEVKKIAKSVELQYQMLLAKEENLQKALEEAKKEVQGLNKKAIQYGVLKREVESNRQMYDMILRRAKETSLTSRLKSTNIFVVDRAEIPRAPIKPPVKRNVLLATVVSLIVGFGLAVFLEHWDNTIHSPNDVKRYLGAPFLGPVGLLNHNGEDSSLDLVSLREPKSSVAEALRNIRTNLVFSLVEPNQKVLVVTSPGPMEGKTFISSNLAVTIARMGRRILLVDADMRKPAVSRLFDVSAKPGLSDLILGQCKLSEAVRETSIRLLRVLPSGRIPPNPAELLTSQVMQKLLDFLRERFDFIIFDTPPILAVTDAAALSGMVDGTVLVVKASETTRDAAQQALEQLKDVRGQALGVVLNQVDFGRDRYYYNYYYKNQYYYSDSGERRTRQTRTGRWTRQAYGTQGRHRSKARAIGY